MIFYLSFLLNCFFKLSLFFKVIDTFKKVPHAGLAREIKLTTERIRSNIEWSNKNNEELKVWFKGIAKTSAKSINLNK